MSKEDDGNSVVFSILKECDVPSAALCFGRVFLQGEEIAKRNGLRLPDFAPFTEAFCRLCSLQSLSYVAKYKGNVIGFMLCEPMIDDIREASEEEKEMARKVEQSVPKALIPVFRMIEHCQNLMHSRMKGKNENVLHMVAMGVLPAFSGRNISGLLSMYVCTNALSKGYSAMAAEATGRAIQHVAEKYTPQDILLAKFHVPYDDFEDFEGLTDCPSCLALCQRIPRGNYHGGSDFSAAAIFAAAHKDHFGKRDLLKLHALYQQACNGDANPRAAPPFFWIVERAKFNAWHSLKGMSKEDAQENLTQHISAVCPSWKQVLDGKMLQNVRPKNPRGRRKIRRIFSGRTATPDEIFWVPDAHASACFKCNNKFTVTRRIHHCRSCGRCCCSACSEKKTCADCLVAS